MKAKLQGVHPVLASNDVPASILFYERLGFHSTFQDHPTEPKYVAMQRDGVELHIQWAGVDQWAYPIDRPAYRIIVSDVDTIYKEFMGSGAISTGTGRGSQMGRAGRHSLGYPRVPRSRPWSERSTSSTARSDDQHLQRHCPGP